MLTNISWLSTCSITSLATTASNLSVSVAARSSTLVQRYLRPGRPDKNMCSVIIRGNTLGLTISVGLRVPPRDLDVVLARVDGCDLGPEPGQGLGDDAGPAAHIQDPEFRCQLMSGTHNV